MAEEKSLVGKVLAEVVGTFILILMGDGVVANVGLAPRTASASYNWNTIAFGWGLAVMVAVYVAGGVSGAHLNPAVTIALAVKRAFPWRDVVPYIIGECTGAFLGAFGVYLCYYDGLKAAGMPNVWTSGPGSTFTTVFFGATKTGYTGTPYTMEIAFITEIIATMVLLWAILGIGDKRGIGVGANLGGLLVGLTVIGIGLTLSGPSGYSLNPARDLMPRLFGALAGTTGLFDTWYWLGPPVIAPIIGGILGALSYDAVISHFLPKQK